MSNISWSGVGVSWGEGGAWWGSTGDVVIALPSPRTLDEILAGSHTRLVSAAILSGPAAGAVLPVVSGSVTLVHDGPVRLAGSLTVASAPEWTEQDAAAALDPRAGVEIALAQGVRDDEGVEHWWQIGVVRPLRHTVTVSDTAIEVSVDVADRGAVVAHAAAPHTMVIRVGDGILAGVLGALSQVAPWLPADLPLDDDWITDTDIVLAERAGDDLWAGCRAAVRNIGRMLTVDATGSLVAPLRTAAQATDPIDVPMLGVAVEVDWEQAVHRVVARWTEAKPEDADSEWQPETGEVVIEDEEAIAALPPLVPITTRKFGGDESVLTSASLAHAAATAELADLQDLIVSGSCSTIPHPDVVPGAVIEVGGRRYRITQTSFDLAGGPVSVSLGNAARTLGVRLAERLGYRTGLERDEIVTSLDPLMARPVGGDMPLLVASTDAIAGVEVGDVIRVVHDGAGRRVATGMIARKSVIQKHSGEVIGRVGGADITVDGDATLRVRTKSGNNYSSYASFSGGDVTVDVPAPPPPPDLSAYAKKVDGWRMYGYGLSPQWPSVPSTWSSSWGANLLAQLNSVINSLNQNRQVFWNQSG